MNKIKNILDRIRAKKQTMVLLKVKAGAKENSIDGILKIDDKEYLKISIKASAECGKANAMLISFFAKELGITKSQLEVKKGSNSPYKLLKINA